jgi:hypothetical protein
MIYKIFLAKLYPNNNSIKVAIAKGHIANAQRIDITIIVPIAVLSSLIIIPITNSIIVKITINPIIAIF